MRGVWVVINVNIEAFQPECSPTMENFEKEKVPVLRRTFALKKAGLKIEDINYWELNQAFSVVGLAHMR